MIENPLKQAISSSAAKKAKSQLRGQGKLFELGNRLIQGGPKASTTDAIVMRFLESLVQAQLPSQPPHSSALSSNRSENLRD
jgi:hypothetical protein